MLTVIAIFIALVFVVVTAALLRAEQTSAGEFEKLRAKRRELSACSVSAHQQDCLDRIDAQGRALWFAHFGHGLEWVAMEVLGVVLALISGVAAMLAAIGKALSAPLRAIRRGAWLFLRRCGQIYIVGARPTLIWSAIPCALYVFIFGPERDKKVDPTQFVAFCGVIGLAVYTRSEDKKRGVASGDIQPAEVDEVAVRNAALGAA